MQAVVLQKTDLKHHHCMCTMGRKIKKLCRRKTFTNKQDIAQKSFFTSFVKNFFSKDDFLQKRWKTSPKQLHKCR